jgi:hypothetical protein
MRLKILVRITGILDFSIVRYSKNYGTQSFGNWMCFLPQVTEETATLLGTLERANLNQ